MNVAVVLLLIITVFNCIAQLQEYSGKISNTERSRNQHFCGGQGRNIQRRSVGGVAAKRGEFPWIASVFVEDSKIKPIACTGVMISTRHLLTAAHCVTKRVRNHYSLCGSGRHPSTIYEQLNEANTTVYVGSHCRVPRWCSYKTPEYSIVQMHVYPGYNPCNFDNDLAIVEISGNVYRVGVPICMPSENEELSVELVAAGYGINPHDTLHRRLHAVNLTYYTLTSANAILTKTPGRSICSGDSGGPLFKTTQSRAIVVGITSSHTGDCKGFGPTEGSMIDFKAYDYNSA
ncbi:Serine protease [Parelaphostrongylus tenuis]|uniref:Serine protease n=1 Tax=Parelaphostrongylus tenuis TaxID=148309 RepID=A0AAD5MUI0_PARTN|nr:Serine protease [Parelaphostrongylus tenuis]